MKCPFCDTEFDVATLLQYDEELSHDGESQMHWDVEAGNPWLAGETDGMRVYACKSCGGEIVGDETLAATSCPYCGNPVILMGQFRGELKPDLIIPFKLDKEAAKRGLMSHMKGKKLLPKVFKDQNHIDEIKGIYVPYWVFNADADADMRYRATRTTSWRDRDYIYTETRHYSVLRSGSLGFEAVPVDGSQKIPNDLMESIEPFDIHEAVDFQTAYLAGYLADKYDVTAEDSIERANERIKKSTEAVFATTVSDYMSVVPEASSIRLSNAEAKYALYPVWLLNTSWKDKQYTFAMNGQTGKFVGDLPADKAASRKWFWLLAAIGAAAAFGITMLLNML
jgi:DNA-directed RNA polymerase subunit RPC12/RpoP